jgi:hypothetical protein
VTVKWVIPNAGGELQMGRVLEVLAELVVPGGELGGVLNL